MTVRMLMSHCFTSYELRNLDDPLPAIDWCCKKNNGRKSMSPSRAMSTVCLKYFGFSTTLILMQMSSTNGITLNSAKPSAADLQMHNIRLSHVMRKVLSIFHFSFTLLNKQSNLLLPFAGYDSSTEYADG